MRTRQRGLTVIGWLILLLPLGIVGYAGIRLTPVYLNYMKVARTLEQLAVDFRTGEGANPQSIRGSIEKRFDIESVDYPTPKDIKITRDGKARPKMVCDGKPNAPVDGTTTICNKAGNGYELENSHDGKTVSKVKVEMSADGKEMTRTANITPPEGDSFTITTTSKKISGGDGASGDWKETSFTESQDTGVLTIQVNGDSVDFKETDNDKPVTAKLDGTPVTMGMQSMSVKQVDPRTLKVTYSNDGKVQRENTFVLSEDGKTIEETDITPAPMASTMSVTFHKS